MKGGMMVRSNKQGIEEVFVIQTEAIDFFAAIVKEAGGKSAVNGRVRFQDGRSWYFTSQLGDRAGLWKKLVSLCKAVAAFYGTDVFRLKFNQAMEYDEFVRILRETKRDMAYA
jgi:hypothetical protein